MIIVFFFLIILTLFFDKFSFSNNFYHFIQFNSFLNLALTSSDNCWGNIISNLIYKFPFLLVLPFYKIGIPSFSTNFNVLALKIKIKNTWLFHPCLFSNFYYPMFVFIMICSQWLRREIVVFYKLNHYFFLYIACG